MRREKKPIDLKGLEAKAGRARAGMSLDLEGKSPDRRARARRALWTQEFLASGKDGKL